MLNMFVTSYSLQGEKSIRALSRVFADYRLRQPKHQRIKKQLVCQSTNKTVLFFALFSNSVYFRPLSVLNTDKILLSLMR